MIKNNNIVTIIKENEADGFKALIIIPILPFLFTNHSIEWLEKIFIKLFDNSNSIFYKKENDLLKYFQEKYDYLEILRSFDLTFNKMSITIVEDETIIKNDKIKAKVFIDLFKNKQYLFNEFDKIEYLIFEYNITPNPNRSDSNLVISK